MSKETAYVLPVGVASSSEPQVFAGFPGRFTPGEPVTVSELGLTASDAADLVKGLGLPLKRTTAEAPELAGPDEGSEETPVVVSTEVAE